MLMLTKFGGMVMRKSRFTPEQIIAKLREAEVSLSKGTTLTKICKNLGISMQTYYRWRKELGGLEIDQAKHLKELEKENSRLKKIVADQALDNAILREVASGVVVQRNL